MVAWKIVDRAFESYYPKRPMGQGSVLRYDVGTIVAGPGAGVFVHLDRAVALSKVSGPAGKNFRVLEVSYDKPDVLGVDPEAPKIATRVSRVEVIREVITS